MIVVLKICPKLSDLKIQAKRESAFFQKEQDRQKRLRTLHEPSQYRRVESRDLITRGLNATSGCEINNSLVGMQNCTLEHSKYYVHSLFINRNINDFIDFIME